MRLLINLTERLTDMWRKDSSRSITQPLPVYADTLSKRQDVPPTRPTQRIKDADLLAIYKAIDMAG